MTVPAPTDTLVDREAAYLDADSGVHALSAVTAYAKKRADGAKGADLRLTRTVERRLTNGRVERAHAFELHVTWPLVSGASSMADDQRYLDAFLELLLARLRGTTGDHTHGIFLSVAQPDDGPDGSTGNPDVTRSDPLAALALETPVLTATVTYGATELLITN